MLILINCNVNMYQGEAYKLVAEHYGEGGCSLSSYIQLKETI
jgi:hypothetical protein